MSAIILFLCLRSLQSGSDVTIDKVIGVATAYRKMGPSKAHFSQDIRRPTGVHMRSYCQWQTLWGYQKKENANIRLIYIACFFFYFHHSRNLLTFLPNITQARTVVVEESLLFFNVDAVFVFLFACLLWSQRRHFDLKVLESMPSSQATI